MNLVDVFASRLRSRKWIWVELPASRTSERFRPCALIKKALVVLSVLHAATAWAQDVQWRTKFGTEGGAEAQGVAADGTGVYVAGDNHGTFPGEPSAGGGPAETDAFVCRYDGAGAQVWCRQFGTAVEAVARGVAADGTGVYVAGHDSLSKVGIPPPPTSLPTLVDPVPDPTACPHPCLLVGSGITVDADKLATLGRQVNGVAADGPLREEFFILTLA